jgi:hypothetical protein
VERQAAAGPHARRSGAARQKFSREKRATFLAAAAGRPSTAETWTRALARSLDLLSLAGHPTPHHPLAAPCVQSPARSRRRQARSRASCLLLPRLRRSAEPSALHRLLLPPLEPSSPRPVRRDQQQRQSTLLQRLQPRPLSLEMTPTPIPMPRPPRPRRARLPAAAAATTSCSAPPSRSPRTHCRRPRCSRARWLASRSWRASISAT